MRFSKFLIFILPLILLLRVTDAAFWSAPQRSSAAGDSDDYYSILGVGKSSTTAEIKKAFRKLSKEVHPDVNKEPGAQERFSAIAEAYEVLTDDEKRKVYDVYGKEGLKDNRMSSGEEDPRAFDPFDFFFGSRRQQHGKRGNEKSEDRHIPLYVSLSQVFHGATLRVSFERQVVCPHLNTCLVSRPDCIGPGLAQVTHRTGHFIQTQQYGDSSCVQRAKGYRKGNSNSCVKCPNGLLQQEQVVLRPVIEPGVKDGHEIRYDGVGDQGINLDAGDVVFVIHHLKDNARFIIDPKTNDIHTQLFITLKDALVGFETSIPHPSGTPVKVSSKFKTKSGGVFHDGDVIVIPQKGMAGKDLVVEVRVRFPKTLTMSDKNKLEEILAPINTWIHKPIPNSIHRKPPS